MTEEQKRIWRASVSKPCHTKRNSRLINWSKADEHAIIDAIEMAGKIRIWLKDIAAEVAATQIGRAHV